MRILRLILLVPAVVILLFTARQGVAAPLRLAVAANFTQTAQQLVAEFTQNTGISATISSGSSGQLFMQITQGAPFDIFLSADTKRPADLITSGMGVAASRFTYAIGQLVLWTPTTHTPPVNRNCVRPRSRIWPYATPIPRPTAPPPSRRWTGWGSMPN